MTVSNIAAPVAAVTTPTVDNGDSAKLAPVKATPTTNASQPVVQSIGAVVTAPVASTASPSAPAATTTPSVAPSAQAPSTQTTPSSARNDVFGTYLRPYAVDSLWNSRPLNPVFGTFEIPKSSYFPTVASGAYSTGMFLASATDAPMTVVGPGSTATNTVGVADPDSGTNRVITLPRWPAAVLPASGTDGHADIVDPITNIVHSFWQLKKQNGRWTAAMYSWSKLGGTGWGDPSHYYQGARAVGIPASAGLIRKHEIKDGLAAYPHALAMSLTFNGLANGTSNPAYIFPATAADNSANANTGAIPQGSLLMLPPNFDSSAIVNPDLRKIVETLKLYGAYVVDRNTGTPFVIYVENDAGFNLMPTGWDGKVASQLDQIRASLRQVTAVQGWIDGNGNTANAAIKAQQNMNILSMRGPWSRQSGTGTAAYDSAGQRLVFEPASGKTVYVNASNAGLTRVNWAIPPQGAHVELSVSATGGATLRLQVSSNGAVTEETKHLGNGQSQRFAWPADAKVTLTATSGASGASSVKASLTRLP